MTRERHVRRVHPAVALRNVEAALEQPLEPERERFNAARANKLGQWFTGDELASFATLELLRIAPDARRILEPCAGDGALVATALRLFARVTAIDVDLGLVAELRRRFPAHRVRVDACDFLTRKLEPHDAAILNPPQHRSRPGWDGEFLERTMQQAPALVAILRLQALTGGDRFDRVWSQIGRGWALVGLQPCVHRPRFRLRGRPRGSPRHDFVVVSLMRRELAAGVERRIAWFGAPVIAVLP